MTGRRLYDALTDAWALEPSWAGNSSKYLMGTPPAWGFLSNPERAAFNRAARSLTPRKRRRA